MSERSKGIIFIILAAFFFSMMTVFVRMAGDLPTMEKALFRNLVAAIVSWIMLIKSKEKININKSNFGYLLLRGSFGIMGLICNFYAIDHLNISDANMLNKLAPFFAILMSIVLLKEKAGKFDWIAVVIAFAGSLLVIKPGFSMDAPTAMIGVLGGFGAGVAYAFVRKLGVMGVKGPVIVMFFSTFSTLVTLPFFIAGFKPMEPWQFLCLLIAGLCATGGQLTITNAYTHAPAKDISVYDYTQVVFAAIWGFVFFYQLPDIFSICGYAVIIGVAVLRFFAGRKNEVKN